MGGLFCLLINNGEKYDCCNIWGVNIIWLINLLFDFSWGVKIIIKLCSWFYFNWMFLKFSYRRKNVIVILVGKWICSFVMEKLCFICESLIRRVRVNIWFL